MVMAGGDTGMVQLTPLEPMPAMPIARRTAIIPIATATTPTAATDAFWFATSDRKRPHPANTAIERNRVASLVLITETGLFAAVA